MKKKYIKIGIVCILLLITGICYSCSFHKDKSQAEWITMQSDNPSTLGNTGVLPDTGEETIAEKGSRKTSDYEEISAQTETSMQDVLLNGTEPCVIYVHLCGEVIKPGVYEVNEGARVIDLIELAGGLSKEAAGDYINQALKVSDGQRIYIPSKKEMKELPASTVMLPGGGIIEEQSSVEELININLADEKELMELPGVGEAKAASIIDYRNANGSFETIEDLMKIPGIKEGLFNKVSPHITVR